MALSMVLIGPGTEYVTSPVTNFSSRLENHVLTLKESLSA